MCFTAAATSFLVLLKHSVRKSKSQLLKNFTEVKGEALDPQNGQILPDPVDT